MRILFLSPRQCWPPLSGAKLREYHFARALGRRAALTYVYFAESGERTLTPADLDFSEKVVGVPKPPAYGAWNLVRGALGRWPLPVLNYTSPAMIAALNRLEANYDLIHLDSIHMVRYVKPLARLFGAAPLVIYNWHNIESEAMRRYGEIASSPARRLYAAHTAGKMEKLEEEILRTAFGHIVCSERERDQLGRIAPAARIAVIENGVDTSHFAGAGSHLGPRRRIVFVGKMDYYPNVEAAASFARRIWPAVRERMPEAVFTIAGSDPATAVVALGGLPGVEVTGTVPDVRPYYRDALAAVVPLRTGGGTRLKILEAMAAGVPVISTPLGAEGLSVEPGRDILIADADQPEAWAGHLKRLAESPDESAKIAAAAFKLVKGRYDWEIVGQALSKTYEDWLASAQ